MGSTLRSVKMARLVTGYVAERMVELEAPPHAWMTTASLVRSGGNRAIEVAEFPTNGIELIKEPLLGIY